MEGAQEADGERAVLRYAVASTRGTVEVQFHAKHAAYTGPGLLVVAEGFLSMSSPGSASEIAVGELRRLDVRTDAAGLTASLERGIEGLRETFRGLLAGDRGWQGT